MSREWKPGDVAVIRDDTYGGVHGECIALRTGVESNMGWAYSGTNTCGSTNHWAADGRVTVVRPLVVIDPEDREQVERLAFAFKSHVFAEEVEAALRSLIAPEKPAEPQGLGAVVEASDGLRYVRSDVATCNPWRGENGIPHEWDDITAVRVLSEGVTA